MSLADKRAVVTGGGTGIGFGIACELASAGAEVLLCGRREAVLREAAGSRPELDLRFEALDVTDREAVTALFRRLEAERGVDILVNSAGVNVPNRSMAEMTPEEWDLVMNVNATGTYNCVHAALPGMRARGGDIFVVASVAGKRALPMAGVAYAASKFAVAAFATAIAAEEAKNGVRVSTIYPGEVDTPLLEKRPEPISAERRATMLRPEDVGRFVAFIAQMPAGFHVPDVVVKPLVQEII